MKEPSQWDENYIVNNLPFGENDRLEFKGRKVVDLSIQGITDIDRDLLSKALSALANTGGGVLVLGINDKTRMVDDGGISINLKSNGTRAWLEDLLPQLVDPPISKINIYEIKGNMPESQILPNRAIYVVDIGESQQAPHQAFDNRYYGRVAGKSRPLNHRMVLDIMNRRQFPNLKINFGFGYVRDSDANSIVDEGNHVVLVVFFENIGTIYAKYVNCILYIPKYLIEEGAIHTIVNGQNCEIEGIDYVRVARENVIVENVSIQGEVIGRGPGRYTPILPGRSHSITIPLSDKFTIHRWYFIKQTPKLIWELYADNAPCQKGEISFSTIQFIKANEH